jgi:hypothetical protein
MIRKGVLADQPEPIFLLLELQKWSQLILIAALHFNEFIEIFMQRMVIIFDPNVFIRLYT